MVGIKFFPLFLAVNFFCLSVVSAIDSDTEALVYQYLPEEYHEEFFRVFENEFPAGLDVNGILDLISGGAPNNESCHTCQSLLSLIPFLTEDSNSIEFIKQMACNNLHSETVSERMCIGLIDRLGMPILHILKHTKVSLEDEGCAVLFGHECATYLGKPLGPHTFWELPLPKMPENLPKKAISSNDDASVIDVLHLTDVHLDLFYEPGTEANCNEALCCRPTSVGKSDNISVKAGYWGEVNGDCDMPVWFVNATIQKMPEPDLIFWTGDNVPHDVWNTSKEMCLEHNRVMAEIVRNTFPDTPVLPALGNHEAHPINLYVPQVVSGEPGTNHSTQWLYDTLANAYWSEWLSPSEKETFLIGGYYSRMITPHWKVVVLNTNHGYKGNFWFLYDPVDPDGQLKWLIKELTAAEKANAKVTILAHIPPSNMYDGWKHNFIRIHDRFRHVITGAFMGHTHADELAVLINENKEPVGVQYISGSLTTFSYLNPSYKMFQLNATTGQPLDYTVFFFDLDRDNNHHGHPDKKPKHVREFTAKEAYSIPDLTPESWHSFVKKASKELDLAYTYAEHFSRHSWHYYSRNRLDSHAVHEMVKRILTRTPFHKHK